MNFWIPPLKQDHAVRIWTAFTVRELVYSIQTGKANDFSKHMGLHRAGLFIWRTQPRQATVAETKQILQWALDFSPVPLHDLTWALHYWWLCIAQQPNVIVETMNLIDLQLHTQEKRTMKTPETDNIPVDVLQRLETSLAALETALLEKDPMMPQHLRNSHSLLISYPETVHLLEDAEIARLISAAQEHTKTEIVKAAASKRGGGRTKTPSVDDL